MKIFYKKGFTLIEVMVVIAIIGMIASIVLYSVSEARIKATNNARIQKVVQWRTALALYHAENGTYPTEYGLVVCLGQSSGECQSLFESGYVSSEFIEYMSPYIQSTDGSDIEITDGIEGMADGDNPDAGNWGGDLQGVTYQCSDSEAPPCDSYTIWYALLKQKNCPVGEDLDPDMPNLPNAWCVVNVQ